MAAQHLGRAVALHSEILPDEQTYVLGQVGPWSAARGFYLAGGTALALWLGHRMSVDLDFFGDDLINAPRRFATDLVTTIGEDAIEIQVTRGTVYLEVRGVKMSWFRYSYPLLQPLAQWDGTLLAQLDDLAAMKLSAIYDRGTRRDFVDLYAILETGVKLADLIALFQAKYPRANPTHLVRALTYFSDADLDPMPVMLWRVTWAQIKRRITAAAISALP